MSKPQRKRASSNRVWWVAGAVVVVIGVALIATIASNPKSSKPAQPASSALVKQVSSLPASVFTRVGVGSATAAPKKISAPAFTAGGLPRILYVGAEYCPYCATERWPMVIALSRFGSFTGLQTTHSSSTDVFPNTATFSFHGANYHSKWIAFSGVETESNQRQGDGYAPLDKMDATEEQIFTTYNAPPYSSSAGGIPFVDFGGRFIVEGAGYDPSVLQGKTADQIASALADPTTDISKGAIGTANTLTAAICSLTHDQPAAVCDAHIQQIETQLK